LSSAGQPGAGVAAAGTGREAVPGKLLARHCVGGPPPWIGTDVRFTLEPAPDGGTLVVFDHTGFAEVDEMFRRVTLGWSQMLLQLKRYTESGKPARSSTSSRPRHIGEVHDVWGRVATSRATDFIADDKLQDAGPSPCGGARCSRTATGGTRHGPRRRGRC
jgi:hypothetical protein